MDRNPDDRYDSQAGSGQNAGGGDSGSALGGGTGAYNTGAAASGASGANAPFNSGTGATGDLGGGAGYGSSGFGNSGDMSGASGYRNETGGLGGTTGGIGGGMHGVGGSMGSEAGRRDQAREKLDEARERLGQAGAQARDWKHRAERGLADRLEQGASRLRSRAQGTAGGYGDAAYAAGGTAGTSNVASDRAAAMEQNLADGMASAADWLRNGDLQKSIETQARNNPGRTLLIALGVGYLLGKAIRRR